MKDTWLLIVFVWNCMFGSGLGIAENVSISREGGICGLLKRMPLYKGNGCEMALKFPDMYSQQIKWRKNITHHTHITKIMNHRLNSDKP